MKQKFYLPLAPARSWRQSSLGCEAGIQMLDSVKGGETVELSLLLAFTAVGSSFSHIVLISVLRLRCGCVKAAGGLEGLSAAQLWIQTPHVIKGHICVISLAHASLLSPPFFSISCPLSPPLHFSLSLLSQQEDPCVWEAVVLPATSVTATLPCPGPLLQTPALCVFYGCC